MNFTKTLKSRTFRYRFIVMLLANIILALGSAFFNLSLMGMHPYNSFVMKISADIGISFGTLLVITNAILFVAEIIWGRKYIGFGTFVNWILLGYFITFWSRIIMLVCPAYNTIVCRYIFVVLGVLIMGFGVAVYQYPDMGIAPYDAASLILADRTPVPYFWCRLFTDGLSAVLTFLVGGIIGLGSLLCVFGLAPFITFFNKHFCRKYLSFIKKED